VHRPDVAVAFGIVPKHSHGFGRVLLKLKLPAVPVDLERGGAGQMQRGVHQLGGFLGPLHLQEHLRLGAQGSEIALAHEWLADGRVGPGERLFQMGVCPQAELHRIHIRERPQTRMKKPVEWEDAFSYFFSHRGRPSMLLQY
jgi:hypothetical protein